MMWMPTDEEWAVLESEDAPHEPAAVLRGLRVGLTGTKLTNAVAMTQKEAVDRLQIAIEEENTAQLQGQEIYDARVYHCRKCQAEMTHTHSPWTGDVYYKCQIDGTTWHPPKETEEA